MKSFVDYQEELLQLRSELTRGVFSYNTLAIKRVYEIAHAYENIYLDLQAMITDTDSSASSRFVGLPAIYLLLEECRHARARKDGVTGLLEVISSLKSDINELLALTRSSVSGSS